MSVIQHHAVIATTWKKEEFDRVKAWVATIEPFTGSGFKHDYRTLFTFSESLVNGYYTLVMTPDGSKEDWADSNEGDRLREKLKSMIALDDCDDGSSCWEWVEVGFGKLGISISRSS